MDDLDDILLTEKQYAEIRQESDRTIQRERENGTGCRYVKMGRAVRYRKRDIIDFIERHLRHSTSESVGSQVTDIAERGRSHGPTPVAPTRLGNAGRPITS
jgi:hypothetical protein